MVILITIILIAFVYGKIYRITENNSWEKLSTTAEDVGNQFSANLQYQTLYMNDYAKIIRKNNLQKKEELIEFAQKYIWMYWQQNTCPIGYMLGIIELPR